MTFNWITRVFAVLILLGLTLVFAGGAKAAGLLISGSVAVAFGQVKQESDTPGTPPETTSYEGAGEAILNIAAKAGDFRAQIELEVDDAQALEVAEHEVAWTIRERLRVIISGQSFGIEPVDGHISVVNAAVGPVGDEEAFLDFSDAGLLNLELVLGQGALGLALLDTCVPECGFAADKTGPEEVRFPDVERRTTVFHLRAEERGFAYNLYASRSKGSFASGTPSKIVK